MKKLEFRDYSLSDNIDQKIGVISEYLKLNDIKYVVKEKGEQQYIYCIYYNDKILEIEDEDYDQLLEKIKQFDHLNEKVDTTDMVVFSLSPQIVKSIMSILPLPNAANDNYFHDRHKENIKQIEQYKLPRCRLMKEDKFALADIIVNNDIDLSPPEINDCLVHNQMPYGNYGKLKDSLEMYYENIDEHGNTEQYEYNDEEDACMDVIESMAKKHPSPLLLHQGDSYIVHSKLPLEHRDMRNHFCNEDILPSAFNLLNSCPEDKHKHHCFHLFERRNGLQKTIIDIKDTVKIDIKFKTERMANIKLAYNMKHVLIEDFYISADDEIFLYKAIEKLWNKGFFLTNFGKEYYKNDGKILIETICVPEWFESRNKDQFEALMVKIGKL